MKLNSLLLAVLLTPAFAASAFAQNKSLTTPKKDDVQPASIRDQALTENAVSSDEQKKSNISSDAQLAGGMLSLKDPRPEVVTRSWKYFLQLSLQEFHPEGLAQNSLRNSFELRDAGNTAMPSVAFGFEAPVYHNDNVATQAGLAAKVGYASQTNTYTFPSGVTETDIRLNSMLVSVKPYVGFILPRYTWAQVILGVEYGTISYMQTSSDNQTSFSQHANYDGWNLGANFAVTPSVAITTEYAAKSVLGDGDSVAIQKNNFELGTRISW